MNTHFLTLSKLAAFGAALALAAGCSTDNFYGTTPLGGTGKNNPRSVASMTPPPQRPTALPEATSRNSQNAGAVATPPVPQPPPEKLGLPADGTRAIIAAEAGIRPAWNEDRTSLKAEKVYFDFSKATIKTRERSKLKVVVEFLKGNAQVSLRIEGNCDERGTEAYNFELGVRRALVVRDYLVSRGITPARIQTLSRGKDNPAVTGEDGRDRALNRRDEFVVLTADKAL